jgi:hypothetical protein
VLRHWEISDAGRIDFNGLTEGDEKCSQASCISTGEATGKEGREDLAIWGEKMMQSAADSRANDAIRNM